MQRWKTGTNSKIDVPIRPSCSLGTFHTHPWQGAPLVGSEWGEGFADLDLTVLAPRGHFRGMNVVASPHELWYASGYQQWLMGNTNTYLMVNWYHPWHFGAGY